MRVQIQRRTITNRAFSRRLAAFLLSLVAFQGPARAQDDGARLYMMVPDQTTIASLRCTNGWQAISTETCRSVALPRR